MSAKRGRYRAEGRGSRTDASFARRSRGLPVTPDVLVVCEGEKTEKIYIKAKAADLRVHARVKVIGGDEVGTDPIGIVKAAAAAAKEAEDSRQPHAAVWAVFDRDEHLSVAAALDCARANGVRVAFSNPCFELWLLLHFRYSSGQKTRDEALRELKRCIPGYTKAMNVYRVVKDKEMHAWANAQRLRKHHQDSGGEYGRNPWTDVDGLVDELNTLAAQATEARRQRPEA